MMGRVRLTKDPVNNFTTDLQLQNWISLLLRVEDLHMFQNQRNLQVHSCKKFKIRKVSMNRLKSTGIKLAIISGWKQPQRHQSRGWNRNLKRLWTERSLFRTKIKIYRWSLRILQSRFWSHRQLQISKSKKLKVKRMEWRNHSNFFQIWEVKNSLNTS